MFNESEIDSEICLSGLLKLFSKALFIGIAFAGLNTVNAQAPIERIKPVNLVVDSISDIDPLDFFIQDVCLDSQLMVVHGASPLDKRCKYTRDLRIGENLYYHKFEYPRKDEIENLRGLVYSQGQDWFSPNTTNKAIWDKITRYDSFPINTVLGRGAIFISDKGVKGSSQSFWSFEFGPDTIHGPDIVSRNSVWRAFALDHSGAYKNVSTHCTDQTDAADSAKDGNISVQLTNGRFEDVGIPRFTKGNPLPIKYVSARQACPSFDTQTSKSEVSWSFRKMSHPVKLLDVQREHLPRFKKLLTMVVNNVKGYDSSHSEPEFYTREFGLVRHESWNNLKHDEWANSAGTLKTQSQAILDSGICAFPPPQPPFDLTEVVDGKGWTQNLNEKGQPWVAPSGGHKWVMVSCRQTTTVIPAYASGGDDPNVWVKALAKIALAAPLLLPEDRTEAIVEPVIKSMINATSPQEGKSITAQVGDTIRIVGTGFSERLNVVNIGVRGCAYSLPATQLPNSRTQVIELTLNAHCGDRELNADPYPVSVSTEGNSSVQEVLLTVTAP